MIKGRGKNIKISPKTTVKKKNKVIKSGVKKNTKAKATVKKIADEKVKKVDVNELLRISREWNKEQVDEDIKDEKLEPIIEDNFLVEDDKDKRLMMWAGVTFFMVAILFFWVINIKKTFKAIEADNSKNDYGWLEIKDEFSGVMEEVKKGMEEIKAIEDMVPVENELEPGLTNNEASKEEIVDLKNRLEELENKIEGSAE